VNRISVTLAVVKS